MKSSYVAVAIVGILMILFGTTFALQGDGMIGGSVMSGNPFWIYAGSAIAVAGLIVAALGFALGARSRNKPVAQAVPDQRDQTSDASNSA